METRKKREDLESVDVASRRVGVCLDKVSDDSCLSSPAAACCCMYGRSCHRLPGSCAFRGGISQNSVEQLRQEHGLESRGILQLVGGSCALNTAVRVCAG